MTEYYTYQKRRRDYGKPCNFKDTEIRHCGYFTQKEYKNEKDKLEAEEQYKKRNPNFIQLDNIDELSEHSVNTERVKTGEKGMYHKEGGWPYSVDPTELQEINRYKKKIDKDPAFVQSTKELCSTVEKCVKQNNQIDMFEEYFENEISEHVVENLSTKTIMLFKDHSEVCKRSVSEISWHPENSDRLAASYAIMRFQQMPDKMETRAFVWNTHNPNEYDLQLSSPSPVTNIAYNHKNTDTIGGGCYNGLVAFWDYRKGSDPIGISPVEKSHHDPISHFHWIAHRLGSECVTTSTDGRCLWWDIRKLENGPIQSLNISEQTPAEGQEAVSVGGTALEYNNEAGPNKYLVGTESGLILTANKKLHDKVDISTRYGVDSGRHLGPIYSIHRSPVAPKYFLSVGDWSAKVWVEDLKQPIIRTKYHNAYLADGCWSPTRNGTFFLARRDGWLDVWDYYYRQNEVAFSHKVSDAPLSCLKINTHPAQQGGGHHNSNVGKLVAVGDQDGTVTILELCDSLYIPQPKEKDIITEMFERELRKEKNLEAIKKQFELAKKQVPKDNTSAKDKFDKRKNELITDVEARFEDMLKEHEKMEQDEDLKELDSPTEQRNQQQDFSEQQHQEEENAGQQEDQQQQEAGEQQQQEQQQQQQGEQQQQEQGEQNAQQQEGEQQEQGEQQQQQQQQD